MRDDEDHWDGVHPEDVIGDQDHQGAPDSEWQIIVEETTGFGRENQRWAITKTYACADRNEARRRGFELAEKYQPEHPASPRGRRIYQVGFDTWLVHVPGMTRDYHFRVSAAHFLAAIEN